MPRSSRANRAAAPDAIIDLSLAAALWGGMYVVSAATFAAIPPAVLALVRLAIGATLLLAWSLLRGGTLRVPRAIRRTILVAGATVAASMLFQFEGTARTSGVEGSIVTMSTPIFVLLFGRLLEGVPIAPRSWAGISVATVGVLLFAARSPSPTAVTVGLDATAERLLGVLLLVGGGAAWALYSSLGRPLVAVLGSSRAVSLSSLVAVPLLAPFALIELPTSTIGALDAATVGAIAYLGVGSTAIAWSAWYRGYSAAPPRVAAGILFLQPLVAGALGVGLLGEPVDAALIGGAALLLGGVALIVGAPVRTKVRSRAGTARRASRLRP